LFFTSKFSSKARGSSKLLKSFSHHSYVKVLEQSKGLLNEKVLLVNARTQRPPTYVGGLYLITNIAIIGRSVHMITAISVVNKKLTNRDKSPVKVAPIKLSVKTRKRPAAKNP